METSKKITINYACSLGGCCQSAQILKRVGFKTCSYPFDWIFSSIQMIMHCMQDDFEIFLSKQYYKSVKKTICEHEYYKQNYGITNMFMHFNPNINKKEYDYYSRCVERFKLMLKDKIAIKLFIIVLRCYPDSIEEKKQQVNELNLFLQTFTTSFILLAITYIPNKQENYHNFTFSSNVHYLELHVKSDSGGLAFANEQDNLYLDDIINQKYLPDLINSKNFK